MTQPWGLTPAGHPPGLPSATGGVTSSASDLAQCSASLVSLELVETLGLTLFPRVPCTLSGCI